MFHILPDPQTNGGLMFSVSPDELTSIQEFLISNNLAEFCSPIGRFTEKKEKRILIV
jgi:selenide,water dikinase